MVEIQFLITELHTNKVMEFTQSFSRVLRNRVIFYLVLLLALHTALELRLVTLKGTVHTQ